MRIGIDCRLAGLRHAGIGRYIENIVQRLPQLEQSIEWVFFFSDVEQAQAVLGPKHAQAKFKLIFAPIQHYTFAEQFRMPGIFAEQKLDLLHVPHFNVPLLYRGPTIITIHDLLWHQQRGSTVTTLSPLIYWAKYAFYRLVTRVAITRARQILVPAETVKKTLMQLFPEAEGKITVTKEGARQLLLSPTEISAARRLTETPSANKPYILYVGSLYPHKNIAVVLRALSTLPEYSLKLVGSRNIFQDSVRQQVRELGLNSQVEFLGFQTDAQLAQLYSGAVALIQPSLSEGFGLTGVEAMALGTPVVASDITIFHEIYQDGALFFNPNDCSELTTAVRSLENTELRNQLSKRGKKVAMQYDWDCTTSETLAAYHSALNRQRG